MGETYMWVFQLIISGSSTKQTKCVVTLSGSLVMFVSLFGDLDIKKNVKVS